MILVNLNKDLKKKKLSLPLWISLTCKEEPWNPSLPKRSIADTKTNHAHNIFKSPFTSCSPKMLCVLGKPKTTHASHIKRQRHSHDNDSDILHHVAASNASNMPKSNVHITDSATFFSCAVHPCDYVIPRWRGGNLTDFWWWWVVALPLIVTDFIPTNDAL